MPAIWSIVLLAAVPGCQSIASRITAAPAEPAHVQKTEQPAASAAPAAEPVVHAQVQVASAADPDLVLFGTDPGRQVASAQPRPLASLQQQTFTEVGRDFDPDLDAAGKRVVFASTRHSQRPRLYMQNVRGKAVIQLTNDPASQIQPRFSPDGKKVAFASDRAGQWDIYILDLETHTTVQATRDEAHELAPGWSPDGKWLVYSRLSAGGTWELWLLNLEDESERCIGPGLLARWSPDGTQLVFQRPRERDGMLFGIWTVKVVAGEPSWPAEIAAEPDAALICPAFSPDGRQVAFCRVPAEGLSGGQLGGATARPGRADLYLVDIDGANRVRLTDGGANFAPCFSAEGRLYFSSDRDGRERIWSLRLTGPARPNLANAAAALDE